jgi:hypothetical protein
MEEYKGPERRSTPLMDTQQVLEWTKELTKISSDTGYLKQAVNEIKVRLDKHDQEKEKYALRQDLVDHCEENEEHIEVAKKAPEFMKKVEDHEVRITALEKTPMNKAWEKENKIKDWIFMGALTFGGMAVLNYIKGFLASL